ncbi:MAG: anti-sigma factor [Candidatus Limnocylindria bacterium]
MAAVVLALAIGVGVWNVTLLGQLAARDDVLRAVATADAVYPVEGEAGSGWLLEADGRPLFVAADLADLPDGRIYELWLIEPDGSPVAVGTLERLDEITVVELERALGGAGAFAVTVERERVEAPTSDPVLLASIDS